MLHYKLSVADEESSDQGLGMKLVITDPYLGQGLILFELTDGTRSQKIKYSCVAVVVNKFVRKSPVKIIQICKIKRKHQKLGTVNDLFSGQCAKERLFLFNILVGKSSPFSAPIMKHFPG